MNSNILLQKLLDIEFSIGAESDSALRNKVRDAQECLLRMHAELVDYLRSGAKKNHARRFSLRRVFSLRRDFDQNS